MKKILFSLVALVASMSMNAQVMKVMKGTTVVATYTAEQADNVVFEEAQGSTTTGTAKATIGGSEVDVNWVQLWENGPKFAEYNVGATSATEKGTTMNFAAATAENFTWGANWCTPSKDAMEHLMTAAKGQTDDKVTCAYTQENSVWGFKFIGKTTGYKSNSVFFPVQNGTSGYGSVVFWSGTADGSRAWRMGLGYDNSSWNSSWTSQPQARTYPVRPVLKN